ncbi:MULTISPECIES: class I adenylate-forming enzyme family protein [unclassified Frankia]|uniref:class I adenylate-forming enzyme family protein n=1 Tax=unclassified Frankia TaxID=2632575 RepID=UPI001EF50BA0|nr:MULTISPECIES: class I adenylate-forming enzyme family protein [unclassified Frankia]
MSIGMLLDMAATAFGDRVALGGRGDGITFEHLVRVSAGGATLLRSSGAERVAYLGGNSTAFPAVLFAAATAGMPFVPLNYRLGEDQLDGLLGELHGPVVVCDEAYQDVVARSGLKVHRSEEWLATAALAEPSEPVDVDDEAPAVLLFTSGTTSKPKAVVLRHSNLVSYVLQTVEFGSAEPAEAALTSVPPYHIAGVGTVLTNIYSGRRLVYLPNFSAGAWLRLVAAEQVTSAMVVPTMLARIVEELAGARAATPTLRSIAYGGARMPRPVLEKALAAFPDAGFVNAYGLTETSSTIAILSPDDHRTALLSPDPAVAARLSSAGRLVPGVEGEIRDSAGAPTGPGEVGELWVRGGQISGEYLGLGSVLDADGWFPTRDRACLDTGGYLFIEGRADDTIIRGGENIAPAEIEDVLIHHPAVKEVAVIGLPDIEWGERLTAVVVPAAHATPEPDDLRAWVRARLRGSRTPDEVIFRDGLPYTPTGKLLRRQLVAEIGSPTTYERT